MGEFPFHDFVRYISGKSSFGMAKAIREFYATLPEDDGKPEPDGRMTEKEIVAVYYKRLVEAGVEKKILKPVFNGRDTKTLDKWAGIDTSRKRGPVTGNASGSEKT